MRFYRIQVCSANALTGDWRDGTYALDLPEWLHDHDASTTYQVAVESFLVNQAPSAATNTFSVESTTLTQGNSHSTATRSAGYQLCTVQGCYARSVVHANTLGIRVGDASVFRSKTHNFRLVAADGTALTAAAFAAAPVVWSMSLVVFPVPK